MRSRPRQPSPSTPSCSTEQASRSRRVNSGPRSPLSIGCSRPTACGSTWSPPSTAPTTGFSLARTVELARQARAARPSLYGDDALALGARARRALQRGASAGRTRVAPGDEGTAPLLPPGVRGGVRRRPRGDAGVVPARARAQPGVLGSLGAGSTGRAPVAATTVPACIRRRLSALVTGSALLVGGLRPCILRRGRRRRHDRDDADAADHSRRRPIRRPRRTTTEVEQPTVVRVRVVGGVPEGGIVRETVDKGDRVVLVVTSDVSDHVHVHGYDLMRNVSAGGTGANPVPGDTARSLRGRARGSRSSDRGPDRSAVTQLAHGIGGVRDLPVPESVFYPTAAIVLVVSFVLLGVALAPSTPRGAAGRAEAAAGGRRLWSSRSRFASSSGSSPSGCSCSR